MPHAYPMMLDVTGRRIVVVGGGAVAARKVCGLLEAGATMITCVAARFCAQMPESITRMQRGYQAGDLEGASLVFAVTDRPEINDQVVRDARARGLLVNRADSDESHPGDFATPAIFVEGDVRIMVSAGSPALATFIRDRLALSVDPVWSRMAAAMQTLRPRITASGLDIDARRRIFRELAGEEALSVLQRDGVDGLHSWLRERHPKLKI